MWIVCGFVWHGVGVFADVLGMTGAINNLASSLAGAPVSSHRAAAKKSADEADKADRRRAARDEFRSMLDEVEHIDATRRLADADQEEAKEDRDEHHIGYTPEGLRQRGDGAAGLDLSA